MAEKEEIIGLLESGMANCSGSTSQFLFFFNRIPLKDSRF